MGSIKTEEPVGTVLLSGSVVATIWDEDVEGV